MINKKKAHIIVKPITLPRSTQNVKNAITSIKKNTNFEMRNENLK